MARAMTTTSWRIARSGWWVSIISTALYGTAFAFLWLFAVKWEAPSGYSLWFPAAGLRFAYLWRGNLWTVPRAALAEMIAPLASGALFLGTSPALELLGAVGPCFVYGLVIHVVRLSAERRKSWLPLDPFPFAAAAIIAPVLACFASLPGMISHREGGVEWHALAVTTTTFALGDMLGILIAAPAFLWAAAAMSGERLKRPTLIVSARAAVIEFLAMTMAVWLIVAAISHSSIEARLAPLLLATCWIGLRTGRLGAWASIVTTTAIVLPITAGLADPVARLNVHMLLGCIAALGYLAGSYAEAEAEARQAIMKRDRLLYQAERLKTLRAMSVAVIHEVSQPLSTIAIEARHLADRTRAKPLAGEDIGDMAALIERKANELAALMRRFRQFGEHADGPETLFSPVLLLKDVRALAEPEARASGVRLQIHSCDDDHRISGQVIELQQALLNLIRNAIAASPSGGTIELRCSRADRLIDIAIENAMASRQHPMGMGVGLIIARSIAEAHGGAIMRDDPAPGRVRFRLQLPAAEACDV